MVAGLSRPNKPAPVVRRRRSLASWGPPPTPKTLLLPLLPLPTPTLTPALPAHPPDYFIAGARTQARHPPLAGNPAASHQSVCARPMIRGIAATATIAVAAASARKQPGTAASRQGAWRTSIAGRGNRDRLLPKEHVRKGSGAGTSSDSPPRSLGQRMTEREHVTLAAAAAADKYSTYYAILLGEGRCWAAQRSAEVEIVLSHCIHIDLLSPMPHSVGREGASSRGLYLQYAQYGVATNNIPQRSVSGESLIAEATGSKFWSDRGLGQNGH